MTRFIDSRGWKRKVRFSRKLKYIWGKKIHSLSCLTRVYLCAKIETFWVFDPCHKNLIFVWFLHGCPLNSSCTLSCSLRLNFPRSLLIFCLVRSVSTSEARSSASASSSSFILKEGDFVNKPIFLQFYFIAGVLMILFAYLTQIAMPLHFSTISTLGTLTSSSLW